MKKTRRLIMTLLYLACCAFAKATDVPELAGYTPLNTAAQTKSIFFDDFEQGNKGWRNLHKNYEIIKGEGIIGSSGMTYNRAQGESYRFISRIIPIEKGKRYRLTATCKIEGVTDKDGKIGNYTPKVISVEYKRGGKWLAGRPLALKTENGSCDWTDLVLEFTAPLASDETTLALYLDKQYTCRQLTWDNVRIEELGEDIPLIYPVLPKALNLDQEGYLKFHVYSAKLSEYEKNLRLYAVCKNKYASAPVKNNLSELRLGKLPDGNCQIKLILADMFRKRILAEEAYPFSINSGPAPSNAVFSDESGRLFCNGKPYFPIGIFLDRPDKLNSKEVLANLKEAGFNVVMPYRNLNMRLPDNKGESGISALKKSLDFLAKHDMKVLFSLLQITGMHNQRIDEFENITDKKEIATLVVNNLKDHPGLLGWYVSDEEPLEKLPPVRELRFLVSALDPYHPTMTLTNLPTNYPYFGPTGDILMIDKYPIYTEKDQTMAPIRECLEMWKTNSGLGQWFVGQIFNWGIYRRTRPYDEFRYPTELEMRSQSLLAMNHGSTGFCFYSYESIFAHQEKRDPGSSKWFWPQVANMTKLLRELEPFFISGEPIVKNKVLSSGKSKVEAMTHTANGKKIVVITSDGPGEGLAVIETGIPGLKSRFSFTRELGDGKYEFSSNNIASDILE